MTLANQNNVAIATGNGVTTVFPYTFPIPGDSATDQTNVEVRLFTIATEVLGAPLSTALWSITGVGDAAGGNVTYTGGGTPLPATHKIVIRRLLPMTQPLDVSGNQGAYDPANLEQQLDEIVMQIQQVAEEVDRAAKVPLGSADDPDDLIADLAAQVVAAAASAAAAATAKTNAETAETNAELAEVNAELAETNAEAALAAMQLPTVPVALNYLRRNAGNTVYENRTVLQALGDLVNGLFTTRGDLLYRGAADPARLAIGSALAFLSTDGTDPRWRTPAQARGDLGVDILSGFRNKIINGDFDFWLRATSQTATGYGSDDRWSNGSNGSTKTHSRQAFTVGQTDVPGNPAYYSRTVVVTAAGAGNYIFKGQPMEGVKTFSGKTVTVTFWARDPTGAKNIAVELYQHFGTGGAPSADVSTPVGLKALTTAWQKFSFTVAIPSIGGKTIGSNNNDHLQLVFWFDAGSNFNTRASNLGQQSGTFDIAHVSIVEGDATGETDPFSPRHLAQEQALCARYAGWMSIMAGRATGATTAEVTFMFPVEMRAAPTATLIDGVNRLVEFAVAGRTITSISGLSTTTMGGYIGCTVAAGGMTSGNFVAGPHGIGGILLDAEL